MTWNSYFAIVALLAATVMGTANASAAEKLEADPKHQLPRPDGKPAEHSKPVKVYVMLGQSNMLGFGRVGPKETKGSLEFMVKEKDKYSHLVDDVGNWTTRQDVRYVQVMDQRGVDYKDMEKFGDVRNEWLTPKGSFGPEPGFGHGSSGRDWTRRRARSLLHTESHRSPLRSSAKKQRPRAFQFRAAISLVAPDRWHRNTHAIESCRSTRPPILRTCPRTTS